MNQTAPSTAEASHRVGWIEAVERLFIYARKVMQREYDGKDQVFEKVDELLEWIRLYCPEGPGYAEVLEGIVWTCVTVELDAHLKGNDRLFLYRSNARAQPLLGYVRYLRKKDRKSLMRTLCTHRLYRERFVAALAVARFAVAVELAGYIFVHASVEEDVRAGIDGWITKKGMKPIPVDIKAAEGFHEKVMSHVEVRSPLGAVGVEGRQRYYLTMLGLRPRVLLARVQTMESGHLLLIERSYELVRALQRALVYWRREEYLIKSI